MKFGVLACRYLLAFLTTQAALFARNVPSLPSPPVSRTNSFYLGHRSPLAPSPLLKLPIGSIKPRGWLRHQLELEANGLTGRLPEISKWCKFKNSAWASPDGEGQFGWEELPYWLKGFGDLGYVLGDQRIIADARKWIDAVLASQEADGYFGPRANKTGLKGQPDLWPHMVMLNVLQSFYEYSGDSRVIPFITRYLKWLNQRPPEAFGRGYWPKIRFGDTLETTYWLYNRTGEPWLLELAKKIHDNMQDWTSGVHDWHNVNIAQGFREPGVFYLQARDRKFLEAAENNYRTVMDTYGQFPGGGFAGDENCRPGFTDPRQGFETCGIVEFMHSFEMLTKISGRTIWADRCEELAFNSLPAALTPDLKALHYLTCANQVQLDKGNKAPGIQNGGTMFSYSPFEVYRCCQHNVSHGWPYYAEELWLATPDNGLCASLYSASEVQAKVGKGIQVTITEQTDYPFADTVQFKLSTSKSVSFPLYLRIPAWCADPSVRINGGTSKAVEIEPEFADLPEAGNQSTTSTLRAASRSASRGYAVLNRRWRNGDIITLKLPMAIHLHSWPKNKDAVSVNLGPLAFSLKIQEQWKQYGKGADASKRAARAEEDRNQQPAHARRNNSWREWEVFPSSPWNYGLLLNQLSPETSFSILRKSGPVPDQPFDPAFVPIELYTRARRIPAWRTDTNGLVNVLPRSPAPTEEPVETIALVPMGAARLRITEFPIVTEPKSHTGQN